LRSSTTLAKKLRQHAEYLKQNPKTVVTLVGYVDDAGSRSYNLAITEQRILAVKQLLRTYGTPASRFVATAIKRNPNVYQPPVSKTCVGWNWFTPLIGHQA
jgi:outer membrane protein OmpA-like peptidoglycan-associated protein